MNALAQAMMLLALPLIGIIACLLLLGAKK